MRHKQSASARVIYFPLCFQRCWCTRPQIQRVFYVRKLLVCSIPFQWVIELGSSKIDRTQNRQGDRLFNAIVLCCFESYSGPTSPWDTEEYATAGAEISRASPLTSPPSHELFISYWPTQHLKQQAFRESAAARMKGVIRMEMSRIKAETKLMMDSHCWWPRPYPQGCDFIKLKYLILLSHLQGFLPAGTTLGLNSQTRH